MPKGLKKRNSRSSIYFFWRWRNRLPKAIARSAIVSLISLGIWLPTLGLPIVHLTLDSPNAAVLLLLYVRDTGKYEQSLVHSTLEDLTGSCGRDRMKLIKNAVETEALANQVKDNGGVYFVPAFSGLGAPDWDISARGAVFGITASVQPQHLVRAVLSAIAYQVLEVVQAINASSSTPMGRLIVDGGVYESNFLMQFQADV